MRSGINPTLALGAGLTSAVAVVAMLSRQIAPGYAFETSADEVLSAPSRAHPMGTDQLGRDVFTGVVQGARTSLAIVLGVVVIATLIGVVSGAASGLRRGVVDDLFLRVVDTVQTVPRFFLAVLVVGWLGPSTRTMVVLLGLTSWPFLARVVRAETLSLAERDFVEAARAIGASDRHIVVTHILPNVLPATAAVVAITASRVVLLEAGLAFLGLGDPNVASWGALVNNAQSYLGEAWWMSVFPGAAITVSVLGMNLLADGMVQALDPTDAMVRRGRRRVRHPEGAGAGARLPE